MGTCSCSVATETLTPIGQLSDLAERSAALSRHADGALALHGEPRVVHHPCADASTLHDCSGRRGADAAFGTGRTPSASSTLPPAVTGLDHVDGLRLAIDV